MLEAALPRQFIGQGVEHPCERTEHGGAEQEQGDVREPIDSVRHRVVKLGYCVASSLSDKFHALTKQRGLLITAVSTRRSFQKIMPRKSSDALSAVPRFVPQRPGDINLQRLAHRLRQFDQGLSATAVAIPEDRDQIRVLDDQPIPLLC